MDAKPICPLLDEFLIRRAAQLRKDFPMSKHYVMLGRHMITVTDEYMKALGLTDGQEIDQTVVNALNRLTGAEFDRRVKEIRNGIDHLRDSRDELLAAAKAIYQAVHGDTVAVGPLWGRLHAAIAAVEEP